MVGTVKWQEHGQQLCSMPSKLLDPRTTRLAGTLLMPEQVTNIWNEQNPKLSKERKTKAAYAYDGRDPILSSLSSCSGVAERK